MDPVTYLYFYSSGRAPNRKIEFSLGEDDQSIIIKPSAYKGDRQWIDLTNIPEEKVIVEMMGTLAKLREFEKARSESRFPIFVNKSFKQLSLEEKKRILGKLEPEGYYQIEIENAVGGPDGYEKVVSLQLFDPR